MNEYEIVSMFYFIVVYLVGRFNKNLSYLFTAFSIVFLFLDVRIIYFIYSLISSFLISYFYRINIVDRRILDEAIGRKKSLEKEIYDMKLRAEKLMDDFKKTEIIYSIFNMLSKASDINSLKSIEKYVNHYTASVSSLYIKDEGFVKVYGESEIKEFKGGVLKYDNLTAIGFDDNDPYAVFVFKTADEKVIEAAKELVYEIKNLIKRIYLFARIEALSKKDGLTGLYRRSVFNEKLNEEYLRAKNFKYILGVMMIDIDHFKNINDTYGHQAGDEILKKIADIIKSCVYETDFVARYGGEEFVVIMPRAQREGSFRKANYIRETVEKTRFKIGMVEIKLTISIGIAYYPLDADNVVDLIEKSDRALYYSKENGRNRVTDYSSIA
jgi:diguanylate cyclase (GGDEF)-like protein